VKQDIFCFTDCAGEWQTACLLRQFKGLKGKENAVQSPRKCHHRFPAKQNAKTYALPFLGEIQEVPGVWRWQVDLRVPESTKAWWWCE
jgi:hypothetical protein